MNNSYSIMPKILILLFVITLISYALGTTLGAGLNIPQAAKLGNLINATAQDASGIAFSYNATFIKALPNSLGFWAAAGNFFVSIGNIIYDFFLFIYSLIVFLLQGLYTLTYAVIVFLPSLFINNLGAVGYIFTLGYGLLLLGIAWYIYPLLLEIFSIMLGLIKTIV